MNKNIIFTDRPGSYSTNIDSIKRRFPWNNPLFVLDCNTRNPFISTFEECVEMIQKRIGSIKENEILSIHFEYAPQKGSCNDRFFVDYGVIQNPQKSFSKNRNYNSNQSSHDIFGDAVLVAAAASLLDLNNEVSTDFIDDDTSIKGSGGEFSGGGASSSWDSSDDSSSSDFSSSSDDSSDSGSSSDD